MNLSAYLLPILGLLALVGLLGLVRLVVAFARNRPRATEQVDPSHPYQRNSVLFTPAERSFLGVLEQAVGERCRIMGKIRLADIIMVEPGLDRSARQKAFNQIQSKHIDFLACDPDDLSVQFAVELDDKSHRQAKRSQRDQFVDSALQAAGVPLFRFPVKQGYAVEEIRENIFGT